MATLVDIVGSFTPLIRAGEEWHGPCIACGEQLQVIGSRWRCSCGAHDAGDDALAFLRFAGEPDPEGALSNGREWTPALFRPVPAPSKWGIHRATDAPGKVLILSHRKHAPEAERLLPAYTVCSWPDGGERWALEPLRGKEVLLWPSAEGLDDMLALERALPTLGASGKIVIPDAVEPPWAGTQGELIAWAKARARALQNPAPKVASSIPPDEGAGNAGGFPPSEPIAAPLEAGPPPEPINRDLSGAEPPPTSDTDFPAEALTAKPKRPRKRLRVVGGPDVDIPQPEDVALPVEMGEDALALHFAAQHGADIRYVKAWDKWYRYDGDGWRVDVTEHVSRLAVELCRNAVNWPQARILSEDGRRKIARRATSSSVRDMARTDRRIAASPDQWDADPYLVGIPGGVFDVQSGKIILGEREHYITKRTSVAPASGVPTRWLAHLDRMMAGDATMIDFLQLFAGYCATGDVSEQVFAFLYGMGQTGKGTFLLTIGELLGDYAVFSEASTFLKRNTDKHLAELARFNGARLVIIDELPSGSVWNEERIKRVTGGGKLTVNFMHSDPFDMQIRFKLAVASNSKPSLRRVGKEMERRIRLVRANASIPDEEVDKQFRERMIADEGPQILNWILQGAVNWKQSGLTYPEKVQTDTQDYLQSVDLLGDWLEECTEQSGETERPLAYANFKAWFAKQGNDHAWGPQAWWSAMEDRGYAIRRTSSARFVKGLSLKLGAGL